jgi:hypothetical protein
MPTGWVTCGRLATLKPHFNKPERTKDFVSYSRVFVVAEDFYGKVNTEGLKRKLFIAGIFVMEWVINLRFPCTPLEIPHAIRAGILSMSCFVSGLFTSVLSVLTRKYTGNKDKDKDIFINSPQ